MNGVFEVISDLAVIIGIKQDRLRSMIIIRGFQRKSLVFFAESAMNVQQQAAGQLFISFYGCIAFSFLVIHHSTFIPFFEALKQLNNMTNMLPDCIIE